MTVCASNDRMMSINPFGILGEGDRGTKKKRTAQFVLYDPLPLLPPFPKMCGGL